MKSLNLLNRLALVIAIVTATFAGSAQADLKAPVTVNARIAQGTGKKTVLIYYANETREDPATKENTDTILGHLRSSDHKGVQKLADAVQSDRVKFGEIVRAEVAAIKAAVVRGELSGVVIFTNEMVGNGRFEFAAVGSREFVTDAIEVAVFDDFVSNSHPLAHADVLRTALEVTAKKNSPAEHEFVLVTKSHGSPERAMLPRLALHAEDTNREELLARLTRIPLQAAGKLDKQGDLSMEASGRLDKSGDLGMKVDGKLNKENDLGMEAGGELGVDGNNLGVDGNNLGVDGNNLGVDGNNLGVDGNNLGIDRNNLGVKGTLLAAHAGTSKDAYSATLATASREHGMNFRLVFVESCSSELDAAQIRELNDSVGLLYTSDTDGLEYKTLDYTKVFGGEDENVADAINNALLRASSK
jgi:hypothetical protein